MAKLLIINGNDLGKEFTLKKETVSIGRDTQNHIRLHDREVSRIHAIITSTNDGYVITDQKSSNGTFVNDRRIARHLLEASELIRLGKTTMLFETIPQQTEVDPRDMVQIIEDDSEESVAKIVERIDAQVALPSVDDDSQITDTFLEHLEENIHVIYQTAVATSRYMKIEQLLQKVLQLIFDWVHADRGCILLIDEATGESIPEAFRTRDDSKTSNPIQINQSILNYVHTRNEAVLTSYNPFARRAEDSGSGSWNVVEALCVPMHGRMGIVGYIYVDTMVPQTAKSQKTDTFENQFSKEQLKMLLAIGHQAALAIENAHYYTSMNQNAQLAAVGETFTQIAHHLRNLLQGLDDAKRMVNRGIKEEKNELIAEGWREVEPITTRIYNLSLNLLSFSKPREPDFSTDDINDAVEDALAKVKPTARDREVTIDWERNAEIKPFAFDTEGIFRAVLNVVQNALDACKAGCVIKIRCTEVDSNVEVSVIDDGEGIDTKELNTIFRPFASTKGELGTGIGLPVSRKILREHGGDIEVASAPGHGSRFTLTIPIRRLKSRVKRPQPDTSMHQKAADE